MISFEVIRRRRLPHWDVPDAPFFLTSCLEGCIPARGLLDIGRYRAELERRPHPPGKTEQEWSVVNWKLNFARIEQWLDEASTVRHLIDPRLAQVVVDAFYYFAGDAMTCLLLWSCPVTFIGCFGPY